MPAFDSDKPAPLPDVPLGARLESPTAAATPSGAPKSPADWLAFLLSAVLSPYIVIPVGTLAIIWLRSVGDHFLLWAGISIFFSTILPVLYVLVGIARGTITDVHVMERDQRGGPFIVAILGGFVAAWVLHRIGAPPSVWGLSLILGVNGLFIFGITAFTKISVHVAVLSATVLGAIVLHPETNPWALLWMIPALIWARQARGRHSVWQGIGGWLVASIVTFGTIYMLDLGPRIAQAIERAT